jgi:hypothetical protein
VSWTRLVHLPWRCRTDSPLTEIPNAPLVNENSAKRSSTQGKGAGAA